MALREDISEGLRLPLDALRLLGKRWPEVLAWTVGGYALHEAAVRGAAGLALSDPYIAIGQPRFATGGHVDAFHRALGFAMLGVAALVTLVMIVGVLHTLRRDLPLQRDTVGHSAGIRAARLHHTLALTLAPFLGFYAGWGLLDADQGYYVSAGKERAIDLADMSVDGIGWWILLATLVLFLLKIGTGVLVRKSRIRPLALVESVLEATYLFLAVFALTVVLGESRAWIQTRAVWQWLVDAYQATLATLPDPLELAVPDVLHAIGTAIGAVFVQLKDAVVQPLVWLAIAFIVYRQLGVDDPLDAGEERRPIRHNVARAATRGVREKYVAFAGAAHSAMRAGLVPFLFFCVWYLAVDVLAGWGWPLFAKNVIGPQPHHVWVLLGDLHQLGEGVLTYALRLPLLAAGFALVLRRTTPRTAASSQPSRHR